MFAKESKSIKFKIILFVSSILILFLIIITIFLLITADISEEELGPSPFNVDESMVSEINLEYQTIVGLGKEISGAEKFKENGEGWLEPEKKIKVLQKYVYANSEVLEKLNLELFKNCKFPKWNVFKDNPQEDIAFIYRLMRLMQYRIELFILTNNFEEAKKNIYLSNKINEELLKRSMYTISALSFIAIKSWELDNISSIFIQKAYTEDQKREILKIKQEIIPTQTIKNTFHFEIRNLQEVIKMLIETDVKKPKLMTNESYNHFFSRIYFKPNKTAKIFREIGFGIVSNIEKPSYDSYIKLIEHKRIRLERFEYFEENYGGKKLVNSEIISLLMVAKEILSCNNKINQLFIAQKILDYKESFGALPTNLTELKLDPKLYMDIFTGEPFLYSAHNGILQSIGKNKKYWDSRLTSKELGEKEIRALLDDNVYGYVLYLK